MVVSIAKAGPDESRKADGAATDDSQVAVEDVQASAQAADEARPGGDASVAAAVDEPTPRADTVLATETPGQKDTITPLDSGRARTEKDRDARTAVDARAAKQVPAIPPPRVTPREESLDARAAQPDVEGVDATPLRVAAHTDRTVEMAAPKETDETDEGEGVEESPATRDRASSRARNREKDGDGRRSGTRGSKSNGSTRQFRKPTPRF
jgi:hypothetical protein